MCRFLLVKLKQPIQPSEFLQKFAVMAKNSKTFDGDWQGDGWGVASFLDGKWDVKKSLKPMWEDTKIFPEVPQSSIFLVHARSASFPHHKNIIEFNQPYITEKYAFVFNGLLKGVSLPYQLEGKIGAQRIWSLLQKYLRDNSPIRALEMVKEEFQKHTKFIQAMNIGLSDGENIYALCLYGTNAEYYSLHTSVSDSLSQIASESLDGFSFKAIASSQVVSL